MTHAINAYVDGSYYDRYSSYPGNAGYAVQTPAESDTGSAGRIEYCKDNNVAAWIAAQMAVHHANQIDPSQARLLNIYTDSQYVQRMSLDSKLPGQGFRQIHYHHPHGHPAHHAAHNEAKKAARGS